MSSTACRMFELIEPIGVIPYAAAEANEAMLALGFDELWDTYFAGRAAALGRVPAELVDALFYNFAPGEVARHIPTVWATATPDEVIAARHGGCVRALRRILREHVDAAPFDRATELLIRAATMALIDGRPMFAALRAIPLADEPVGRFFQAVSMLREHRGDGHIAALRVEGVSGLESHVLIALDMGMPAAQFDRLHHLPTTQLDTVIDGLRDRHLVGDDGWLTDAGRALRRRVEALTDDIAAPPYDILAADEVDELLTTLEPLAVLVAADQTG